MRLKFGQIALVCGLFYGCAHQNVTTGPQPEPVNHTPLGANLPQAEVPFATVDRLWFQDSEKVQFNQLALWAQGCPIDPNSCDSTAKIQVDWWQLWEVDPKTKQEVLIYEENYSIDDLFGLDSNEGGIYTRYPSWYADDLHYDMDHPISTVAFGYLGVYPMQASRGICHWWMPRQYLKRHCGYIVKARFRIEGNVALQFGLDFWKQDAQWGGNNVNNVRSWNSGWYGDNPPYQDEEWQEITFPVYLFP